VSDAAHGPEHAVEIQLPFLQRVLEPLPPVVPVLVPALLPDQVAAAAGALGDWTDGETLWIVSSDMTHFGPAYGYVPFTDRIPERIAALDRGALDLIAAWDAAGLADYGRRTGITMCGLTAMVLAMSLPWPRRPRVVELGYARSGDRDGDYSLSVSYAAAAACLAGGDR
jgi:AmmeMemoRadiSam system protein B